MNLSEEQWQARLDPEEFRVLRRGGTEPPGTGKYLSVKDDGTYRCRACGAALFASDTKFDSGSGWPSFDQAIPGAVRYLEDRSLGQLRTEIRCATCDSHLGHRFDGEGFTPTGARYCVNSVALHLDPTEPTPT